MLFLEPTLGMPCNSTYQCTGEYQYCDCTITPPDCTCECEPVAEPDTAGTGCILSEY